MSDAVNSASVTGLTVGSTRTKMLRIFCRLTWALSQQRLVVDTLSQRAAVIHASTGASGNSFGLSVLPEAGKCSTSTADTSSSACVSPSS